MKNRGRRGKAKQLGIVVISDIAMALLGEVAYEKGHFEFIGDGTFGRGGFFRSAGPAET